MDKTTISRNIEKIRNSAGITQEELAERTGISRTAIRNILTAEVNLINKHLPAIADALGVSLEELLLGYEPCDPEYGLLKAEFDRDSRMREMVDDYENRLSSLQCRVNLLEALCENQKERIRLLEQLNGMEKLLRKEND